MKSFRGPFLSNNSHSKFEGIQLSRQESSAEEKLAFLSSPPWGEAALFWWCQVEYSKRYPWVEFGIVLTTMEEVSLSALIHS
ncbi:hypothetical protein JCM33374_g1677 [Metschnikowia sp. JCM 33374]|nr:hypothetical protein JCM33374_g1677 [Metschnikowia sp. JCM 33374]